LAYCEGEIFHGGEVRVRAKGKFVPMSREETAEVMPYLKFHDCRKFRGIFDEYR